MSAYKLTYLYCDGGNECPRGDGTSAEPFVIDPLPEETAASQREHAKAAGWIRRNGKDYCSLCADRMRSVDNGTSNVVRPTDRRNYSG
jgi:hypothetical protein